MHSFIYVAIDSSIDGDAESNELFQMLVEEIKQEEGDLLHEYYRNN